MRVRADSETMTLSESSVLSSDKGQRAPVYITSQGKAIIVVPMTVKPHRPRILIHHVVRNTCAQKNTEIASEQKKKNDSSTCQSFKGRKNTMSIPPWAIVLSVLLPLLLIPFIAYIRIAVPIKRRLVCVPCTAARSHSPACQRP